MRSCITARKTNPPSYSRGQIQRFSSKLTFKTPTRSHVETNGPLLICIYRIRLSVLLNAGQCEQLQAANASAELSSSQHCAQSEQPRKFCIGCKQMYPKATKVRAVFVSASPQACKYSVRVNQTANLLFLKRQPG